jgi:hypothetical protein
MISLQNYAGSSQHSYTNHENISIRNIGQGEARRRKYKRLELGGGQAYNRSVV